MASPSAADILGISGGGGAPTPESILGGVVPRRQRRDDDDDGGILGTLSHILHRTPANLRDAALDSPGGIAALGHAAYHDSVGGLLIDALRGKEHGKSELLPIGKGFVTQVKEDARHPLRDPGYTILDLLPFVSGGASATVRLGQAGRAAKAGESAGRAFLTNPAKANVREITAPSGAGARGHYSRSGLGFLTQRTIDAGLQKGAAKRGKVGRFAENRVEKRIDKWTNRQLRVEQAILDSKVTRLAVATAKINPVESRALRMAFEKLPVGERIAAATQRVQEAEGRVGNKPGADRRTVRRLQDREQWEREAVNYLDVDAEGVPSLKRDTPEGERLGHMLDLMGEVYGDRESILKALNIMDDAALEAAKLKVGRFVLGAHWVRPTAARQGRGPSVVAHRRYVEKLQRHFDKLYDREKPGRTVTRDRKLNRKEAEQHLAELRLAHDEALKKFAEAQFGPVDMAEVRLRNRENARARRQAAGVTRNGKRSGASGRKSVLRPTVWQERFNEAQRLINEQIAKTPDHPVMQRWAERQAELDRLEAELSPDMEDIFGEGPAPKRKPTTIEEKTLAGSSTRLERLGAALGVAKEQLAEAEARGARYVEPTGVVGAEHLVLPEGAGFIGYPRRASVRQPTVKVSSSGTLGHTRDAAFRPSKGETIRYGLEEENVGKILAGRGRAANKLKMLHRRVELARKGGTSYPTRSDDVFVWNDDELLSQDLIPPDVKDFIADPEKFADAPAERRALIDQLRGAWLKPDWQLSPEAENILAAAAKGKGVFVHRTVLGDIGKPLPSRLEGKLGTVLDTTNNIQKSLLIYLKANYVVVQALSNTAMNFIQQGFAAPKNIARAIHLTREDPELAAVYGDVMGVGALVQLAGEASGASKIARGSAAMTQRLAHFMGSKVDGPARLSAILYEADKAGFKTHAQLKDLAENPEHIETLGEVAQRAKEAIVDYSEMSATEQALIRRMFFVYPWLKGSTKWTAHFLRDHPVQAGVLGQLGQYGHDNNAPGLELPSYARGSFLARGGLASPSGVNPLQTPVSIAQTIAGITGDPTAPEGAQFLTPALGTTIGLLTGRNSLGIPLKGNTLAQLRQLLIEPTYAAQLARAGARSAGLTEGKEDAKADLIRILFGSKTTSKSYPDPNDPYWRFFLGGLYPREFDERALKRAKALEESNR